MVEYLVAGLVLGTLYALASVGLVISYRSSGVLNFAFGALAFAIARLYYYLHSQLGLAIVPAALLATMVAGPLMGALLWALLFRLLREANSFVKIASTVGLSVAIPAVVELVFGNTNIVSPPGLAPVPVHVFRLWNFMIDADQALALGFFVLISASGLLIMKYTDFGLTVRATVSSESMTALSGTSPQRVSVGVWVLTTWLAGLVGVLVTPSIGINSNNFTLLMAGCFSAVVVARFENVGVAAFTGLLFGVATEVADRYLPASSNLTADAIVSIPTGFMVIALIYFAREGTANREFDAVGPLDKAVRVTDSSVNRPQRFPWSGGEHGTRAGHSDRRTRAGYSLFALAAVAAIGLVLLSGFWASLIAQGFAFSIIFLSFTLVTGQGGMVWLCEVSFAGLGAVFTAQLNGVHGWPVLGAIFVSGLAVLILGLLVGLLVARFSRLYVALATLTLALLVDNVVFQLNLFDQLGAGVPVGLPSFALSPRVFGFLLLGIFVVAALSVARLQRSTAGMALSAVRSAERGAEAIGIRVTSMKIAISGVAAFVAAVGGGLLASYGLVAVPASFATGIGLVWFAVIVTTGLGSIISAAIAGLSYSLVPGVFAVYLSPSLGEIPTALFGIGAVMVVKNPDGVVAMHVRLARRYVEMARRRWPSVSSWLPFRSKGGLGEELDGRQATESARPFRSAAPEGEISGTVPMGSVTMEREAVQKSGDSDTTRPGPVLEARRVSVSFGGVVALSDVSVMVPHAAIIGLVGANGAGKTTLFGVISGLVRPQAGSVFLQDEDISKRPPEYRARRGMGRTFQHPELFGALTVWEHLVLADRLRHSRRRLWSDLVEIPSMRASRKPHSAEVERVSAVLDMLELGGVANQLVGGLPLGLGRLVEVGRALALDPLVLLLDEPSAGLDTNETQRLCTTLKAVSHERNLAMLLVEHDMSVVLELSEAVYALNFGEVIAYGSPNEIRSNEKVRAAYLGENLSTVGGGD